MNKCYCKLNILSFRENMCYIYVKVNENSLGEYVNVYYHNLNQAKLYKKTFNKYFDTEIQYNNRLRTEKLKKLSQY